MIWYELIFYMLLYSYIGIGFGYISKRILNVYSLENQFMEQKDLLVQDQ